METNSLMALKMDSIVAEVMKTLEVEIWGQLVEWTSLQLKEAIQ